jgi:hypothetical protein
MLKLHLIFFFLLEMDLSDLGSGAIDVSVRS